MGLEGLSIVTMAQKQKGKMKIKLYLVLHIEIEYFHPFLGFILNTEVFSEVGNCYLVVPSSSF